MSIRKSSRREVLSAFAMSGAARVLRAAPLASTLEGQAAVAPAGAADRTRLVEYFHGIATSLLRPAEGVLRYPSVSPSLPNKQYSTELWDWDTYWTSRGLFRLARTVHDSELHRMVSEHARGSFQNFFEHQSSEGRIPLMISVGNADPFGCLRMASPNPNNQAKPVMAQLGLLVSEELGSAEWLHPYFDKLVSFYASWTDNNQSSTGLLVWGDDVAIGNDNDPTTFGRPPFSSANLLLNCLFYRDLEAAAEIARRLGRDADSGRLSAQARELARNMERYCWDPRDRFYYTVDVQCVDRRAELIPNVARGMPMSWKCLPLRIQTFTGFMPLWCGVASRERAAEMVRQHYTMSEKLRAGWGVRSLSKEETMYSLAASSNPSNWLGPVWIIVNYMVWVGLRNYGFAKEANDLAVATWTLLGRDLARNGSLNEYYHPDAGEALSHKGFVDWNMLVLEMV